nr:unnamed protein product [Spirometra erinaceieuropaei]
MRIIESGIDRSLDTPSTSCTSTGPSSTQTSPLSTVTVNSSSTGTISETDIPGLSCPKGPRTFTSCIVLVGHLRVHRTEAVNQYLTHQATSEASISTAPTAPARSPTAWAYYATCTFTETYGKQPPPTLHHYTFPHQHLHQTTPPTTISIRSPPLTQMVSVHLDSASMRLLCCLRNSSLRLS